MKGKIKTPFKLLIISFFLIYLVACSNRLSMIDYIDFNLRGADGTGTISYNINTIKFINDTFQKDITSLSDLTLDEMQEVEEFMSNLHISLSKVEEISNGDKIDVSIKVLGNYEKNFKEVTHQLLIEGLEENVILYNDDLVNNFEVNFTGINGLGKMNISNKYQSVPLRYLDIYYDFDANLSNGDKLFVRFTNPYILDPTKYSLNGKEGFEVTVSGLEENSLMGVEDIEVLRENLLYLVYVMAGQHFPDIYPIMFSYNPIQYGLIEGHLVAKISDPYYVSLEEHLAASGGIVEGHSSDYKNYYVLMENRYDQDYIAYADEDLDITEGFYRYQSFRTYLFEKFGTSEIDWIADEDLTFTIEEVTRNNPKIREHYERVKDQELKKRNKR